MKRSPTEPYACPFVIAIDSAEQSPFTFTEILADADQQFRPMAISSIFKSLGRFPNSQGDYSIEGLEHLVGVERKALEDIQGTVLGWPSDHEQQHEMASRQDRFKKELENLTKLAVGAVVIEAHEIDCIRYMPAYGSKSVETNQKSFRRITLGMQLDFRVPWYWCSSRRDAECYTFRLLWRAWRKLVKEAL